MGDQARWANAMAKAKFDNANRLPIEHMIADAIHCEDDDVYHHVLALVDELRNTTEIVAQVYRHLNSHARCEGDGGYISDAEVESQDAIFAACRDYVKSDGDKLVSIYAE